MGSRAVTHLSIVLPVINERLNLELLIPDLIGVCEEIGVICEVIVVDDGSTDGTDSFIELLNVSEKRISRIDRGKLSKSLPESLNTGISAAKYEFILWMDADGSMPAATIKEMIKEFNKGENSEKLVVVGSRFVSGGGFKGADALGKTSLLQAHRNLKATNDSFTAMVLSRILNYYLYLALGRCCKDPATGFVLAHREQLSANKLKGSYGDYCPRFLFQSYKKKTKIIEVPYICLPRQFGESKTGTNLGQLIKRGFPYVLMPIKIRFSR